MNVIIRCRQDPVLGLIQDSFTVEAKAKKDQRKLSLWLLLSLGVNGPLRVIMLSNNYCHRFFFKDIVRDELPPIIEITVQATSKHILGTAYTEFSYNEHSAKRTIKSGVDHLNTDLKV